MTDDPKILALVFLSALVAGVINAIAGGGTLFTFSALLAAGLSPVVANATSTVALVPGSLAGAWGYRREMRTTKRWTLLLILPSILGGVVGSLLVTRLDEKYFSLLVPWLILIAALLLLSQPIISRVVGIGRKHAPPTKAALAGVVIFQFMVAIYGGYFGAGIGILMLSALGLMGLDDIHQMNALKTLLAACINGVSVLVFVEEQKVAWPYALIMAVAAIVGGYCGAHVARRMNRDLVRWIVVAISFGLAGYYFYQQWTKGSVS
jgi:uncharacterized membrane protein YfcA